MENMENDLVICFSSKSTGHVVVHNKHHSKGSFKSDWVPATDTTHWKPYIEPELDIEIFEWEVRRSVKASLELVPTLMTEEQAKKEFETYFNKVKTGRSWILDNKGNIKMKVKLTMASPGSEIGENAKLCYNTKALEQGGKDITETLIHNSKHLSALRFAYATVQITGISVPAHVQIVRSGSHMDFMVRSLRYVNINKDGSNFVMPTELTQEQQDIMLSQWESSTVAYNKLLDLGVKKEDARAVLSTNVSTSMALTGNLQAFWDFFILRLSPRAQKEVRAVAVEIFKLLQTEYPQVFKQELFNKWYKEGHND